MCTEYTIIESESEFPGPDFVDWRKHPKTFPPNKLVAPSTVDRDLCEYQFGVPVIKVSVDIEGREVECTMRKSGLWMHGFVSNESVLAQENRALIHLTFEPGVCAVGARVGCDGEAGSRYRAQMFVEGQRPFDQLGEVSANRGSAPFVGVRAPDGVLISEVWFGASRADPFIAVTRIAIGNLHFLL